jgi:putative membrane protein
VRVEVNNQEEGAQRMIDSERNFPLSLRANHSLRLLLGWYVVFWVAMAISPLDRSDWLLENLLVFVAVGFLAATYRSFPLSNFSYLLITIFMTLHAVGAHYTYEHVPPGYWMKDLFELERNHFDRIVHFAFGLLIIYPVREALQRSVKAPSFWTYFLPLTIVLAASGFYEVLESWVAQIVSPELGAAYLGTQGDVWDAQKDMTAAMIGALLSLAFIAVLRLSGRM